MKIDVALDPKSIRNAIKSIKKQKQILTQQMIPEYLQESANWIINRANELLDRADIGEDVKSAIFKAWDTQWVGTNHLKVLNHSRHAAYVEFGVGVVGQSNSHPNSQNASWKYNIPTEHKNNEGGWIFTVRDMNKLDIPQNAIVDQADYEGKIIVYTRGTEGVWYLFNAVEDFKINYQNKLWEKIKKKYWS